MNEPMLVKVTSAQSARTAVVLEEDDSVWLYLTAPGSDQPERDCWLFNKPSAPSDPDMASYRRQSAPPPAPASYIVPESVRESAAPERWTFTWPPAGDAVVVAVDGLAIGFTSIHEKRGMSRYLARSGPWGSVWDDRLVTAAIHGVG